MRAVAVAALVLLTACNGSPNQRPNKQAHATTTASTTTTTVVTTTTATVELARACTADDLGIESTQTDGAGGHVGLFLQLMNVSSSKCSLSGYPTAMNAMTADGHALDDYREGTYFPEPLPGNLEPRAGNGSFVIETTSACMDGPDSPPPELYRDVQVSIPGGGRLSLGAITIDGKCGVAISKLGVVPQQ